MNFFNFVVNSKHKSLVGHFPGNPIVPGAVIIEHVLQGFFELGGAKEEIFLPTVKFVKPILSNQRVTVFLKDISPTLVSFECICNDEVSVLGRLKIK
ncbi:MAG: hypothetical protein DSY43_03070 [Gammaproteobacteria bacterium]|uniref:ApeI dehydratase-like domain-containing protein n=1 Tax=endosymbiont of Bathymodiolus septemdierum str. Myojin knoll TaxID=1303921 RepID=A0A0N7KBL2_9GAMM|nr:hypothetical protein [Bathymodiolus septemdierum thioautotrophic gill symbiont]RUA06006.1 MAG: hypothetical protein DSY43_03070 [Gammaproteobacteria bacterium]BAS68327.1 conserved hypothetical protein [endosymbiont of Bathymodiolus septemdierum str. Myojin knoll]